MLTSTLHPPSTTLSNDCTKLAFWLKRFSSIATTTHKVGTVHFCLAVITVNTWDNVGQHCSTSSQRLLHVHVVIDWTLESGKVFRHSPEFMYLNSSVIIQRTRVTMLTLVDVYIRALPRDLGRVIADIIAVFVWDFIWLYFFGWNRMDIWPVPVVFIRHYVSYTRNQQNIIIIYMYIQCIVIIVV